MFKIKGLKDSIEIRGTFQGPDRTTRYGRGVTCDFGQMLVVVTKDRVRISMNGPCNMTDYELDSLNAEIRAAKELLRGGDQLGLPLSP